MAKFLVINGVLSSFDDLKTLKKWLEMGKTEITFLQYNGQTINIITKF